MKIEFFKYLKFVRKQENDYVPNKLVIYYNKSPYSILYSIFVAVYILFII